MTGISYLVTVSNETRTLDNLLNRLTCGIIDLKEDEIIILMDSDCIDNNQTKIIIENYRVKFPFIKYFEHSLNRNYSEHKNYGATKCGCPIIFQIDSDECPTENLLLNIKDIINNNPTIECFWITRVNDFIGNYDLIARQWGWKLTPSTTIIHIKQIDNNSDEYIFLKNNNCIISDELITPELIKMDNRVTNTIKYKAPLVNFPDPQCRCFLNKPDRIKWVGRLHERIEGNINHVYLPFDEELSLYHDKNIETQLQTNIRYNKIFTEEENKGYRLPI